jgi:hypothetical protein
LCSEPDGTNACGGCTTLSGTLGETCGPCGIGTTVCDGSDALLCEGGTANGCGGCQVLTDEPGDACGCGAESFDCDGAEALVCLDHFGDDTAPENLGSMPDHVGWTTLVGVLHDAADEDWYVIDAEDGPSVIQPEATLDADEDYVLCAFYERSSGEGPPVTCLAGIATSQAGVSGCCSDNAGTTQESVILGGVEDVNLDDSGTLTIVVSPGLSGGSCVPYTLRTKL